MSISAQILEELKEKLLGGKKRIEKELSGFADLTETEGNYKTKFNEIGSDMDENATETEEYADNLALENSLEKQLKSINRALLEIENHTYGICKKCGKEMDTERLRAYPSAETCVHC